MRSMVLVLWLGAVAVLAAGFLGRFHPAADTIAVLRVPAIFAVCALAVALAFQGRRRLAGLSVVGLVLSAWSVLPSATGGSGGGAVVTLYQKNLLFGLEDRGPILDELTRLDPDVITLQEVGRRNRALLQTLSGTHGTQQFCPFLNVSGVAVLSRFPMVPGTAFCNERLGMAGMQVTGPEGPLWVVSIHMRWPWPFHQPALLAPAVAALERLDGPVLVGGDFNAVTWSHTTSAIRGAARARAVSYRGGTFDGFAEFFGIHLPDPLRVPIDQVLIPSGAVLRSAEKRPLFGSDHNGLWVTIRLGGPA